MNNHHNSCWRQTNVFTSTKKFLIQYNYVSGVYRTVAACFQPLIVCRQLFWMAIQQSMRGITHLLVLTMGKQCKDNHERRGDRKRYLCSNECLTTNGRCQKPTAKPSISDIFPPFSFDDKTRNHQEVPIGIFIRYPIVIYPLFSDSFFSFNSCVILGAL